MDQYNKLKAAGLCIRCHKEPASPTHVTCEACSEKDKYISKQLRASRKAEGLCTQCGKIADSPTTYCAKCRSRRKGHDKKVKDNRMDTGRCPRCGQKKVMGEETTKCLNCAEGVFYFKWN